jgi:hypothetical protein
MPLPRVVSDLLGEVRVYSDEDAFVRDERKRPRTDFQLKLGHDRLYQLAMDLKLAARLCVLDWKRPPQFRAALQVEVERASWWPGNWNPNNNRDLLSVPLAPASEAVLGRTWLNIRALAETAERTTLWHDDPALVFAPAPGVWLGRAACIGHEGLVHYFVYGRRERQWEEALAGAGLRIQAQGEAAYRQHFAEPGRLGG